MKETNIRIQRGAQNKIQQRETPEMEAGNKVDWPFVDDEKGNSDDRGGGNNIDTFFI